MPRQDLLFEIQTRPLLEPIAKPGDLDPLPQVRPEPAAKPAKPPAHPPACLRCGKASKGRLYCPACRAFLEKDRERFTRKLVKSRLADQTQELF